jgi:hypothetical protein
MAERAESAGRPRSAARFRAELEDMSRSIDILHRLLGNPERVERARGTDA